MDSGNVKLKVPLGRRHGGAESVVGYWSLEFGRCLHWRSSLGIFSMYMLLRPLTLHEVTDLIQKERGLGTEPWSTGKEEDPEMRWEEELPRWEENQEYMRCPGSPVKKA